MTWRESHERSERYASEAHLLVRQGRPDSAEMLFAAAAAEEIEALKKLDASKPRTVGITVVSAVSLSFKARQYPAAEKLAMQWLINDQIPPFAAEQLRQLVQEIWIAQAISQSGSAFLPGRVLVSVRGGQTLPGGAPLSLILDKVQTVQSLFFRTIEFLQELPHRRRGPPAQDIQETCRPWIFQAAPGSYQFSVAIEDSKQLEFFKQRPSARQVSQHFMTILSASVGESADNLSQIVKNPEYQQTFLKLARNLAPTGKNFSEIEVRQDGDLHGLVLEPQTRTSINRILRPVDDAQTPTSETVQLRGVLRALHLERDWLELAVDQTTVRVGGLVDAVDDIIGPLVNRKVVVTARHIKAKYEFLDIEADE